MSSRVEFLGLDWVSERHLRVTFAVEPPAIPVGKLRQAAQAIRDAGVSGLSSATLAWNSLLVEFDPSLPDEEAATAAVRTVLSEAWASSNDEAWRAVEIPACFEGAFAPDVEAVAAHHGIPPSSLVEAFCAAPFVVRFVGFCPGFAYLSGLPSALETPRLSTPRVRVPAGSVGIAGDQAGVYPLATPGGWRLIGRTPRVMFDARRNPPALLSPGDRVRFVPIRADEFHAFLQRTERHV